MWRTVGGIVVGYLVFSIFVFVTFALAYTVMGTDRAFEFDTYDVTGLWSVTSVVLGLLGALLAGFVCRAVARSVRAAYILAGIVLVWGLCVALLSGTPPPTGPRPAEVSFMQAAQMAREPMWLSLVYPVVQALGVVLGGRTRTRRGVA